MNGFFADIIFHVKKEFQKKHLTVHVRMKKRLKSYSLIRVETASLTSQKSGLLCKVKVIITGKTLMSFWGAADGMPKNELLTFENLQAPPIFFEKMLLLTAIVSLLWIIAPVAGSAVAVKGVLFIQVDW